MKNLKKIITGVLSLVLVFGMGIMLTGCSGVKGTYNYIGMTFTIITNTETKSDGSVIITETRELTSEEYYLYKEKHVALDKLAQNKVQDSDKVAYEAWLASIYPSMQSSVVSLTKDKITFTEHQKSVGDIEVDIISSGSYKKVEDKYVVSFSTEVESDITNATRIVYMNFTVDKNNNIHFEVKNGNLEQNAHLVKGALYSTNIIYAKAK